MGLFDKYTGTTTYEIDGLTVVIQHKKIKRINLRLREDGTVSVSLPIGVCDTAALDFVRAKYDWIMSHRERQTQRRDAGRAIREYTEVDRRNLKKRIERILPMVEARTGLHCNGWTVRKMTTRWGSCNTRTHHINLSLMLCDQPDEALEYVIVHELIHTSVSNHGAEFKAYMDRLMPNWRAIKKNM